MMLNEIIEQLEAPADSKTSIPASQVRQWMGSQDLDTLGATYVFLVNGACVRRVSPAFSFDEVFNFTLRYYELCLLADPDSDWADSRYSAGWDMVRWFVSMWDDGRESKCFELIKSKLAALYKEGSQELRSCIELAIMEHLFERKAIRNFFKDWNDDPKLQPAYEAGILWVSRGGKSPLSEKRPSRS